jgi:hypothetical protein
MPVFQRANGISCLRPRGHCDRQTGLDFIINISRGLSLLVIKNCGEEIIMNRINYSIGFLLRKVYSDTRTTGEFRFL